MHFHYIWTKVPVAIINAVPNLRDRMRGRGREIAEQKRPGFAGYEAADIITKRYIRVTQCLAKE